MENFWIALVLFLSGLIHGLVGFAFALTAIPLLALIKGIKFSVPLISLFSFTVNLIMIILLKERKILKLPLKFFGIIFLGVFLGVKSFSILSEILLRWILFFAILIFFGFEIYQLSGKKEESFNKDFNFKAFTKPLALLVAFLVGFLGGILNTPGPPIVMHLTFLKLDKKLFKATLQVIFAFSALNAIINHFLVGNLNWFTLKLFILNLPLVLLGLFLGHWFYGKISNKVYYYLVNFFLMVTAILLLFKNS